MAESAAIVLDARRRQLGLSRQDCWFAYFTLGGHADPGAIAGFLAGSDRLPPSEIDILTAALDEHELVGGAGQSAGATPSGDGRRVAPIDQLVDWLQQAHLDANDRSDHPLAPATLDASGFAVNTAFGTRIQALGSDSSITSAGDCIIRIDAAEQDTWEVHHHGDELLVLLAGQVEVTTDRDRSRVSATLTQPRQTLIIPQGRPHRHHATRPGTALLYLTPSGGNESVPSTSN